MDEWAQFDVLRVDVWRKSLPAINPVTKERDGAGLKWVRVATDVPAQIWPSSDVSRATPIGRMNVDALDTTDRLVVRWPDALAPDDYVQLTTAGHPETGTWYAVKGGAQNWNMGPSRAVYMIGKTVRPDIEVTP
ncbi:hypothetical protein [Microcystis phage Mae-JY24]